MNLKRTDNFVTENWKLTNYQSEMFENDCKLKWNSTKSMCVRERDTEL